MKVCVCMYLCMSMSAHACMCKAVKVCARMFCYFFHCISCLSCEETSASMHAQRCVCAWEDARVHAAFFVTSPKSHVE